MVVNVRLHCKHILGAKQPRQNLCILPFTLHSKCASFSGLRKSTSYRVSLYTRNLDSLGVVFFHIHKTHFINSLRIVLRACRDPGGRDGHCMVTRHIPPYSCKLQDTHSTCLGQANHHEAWISGGKGTEVPRRTPNDSNHTLQIKWHAK